MFHEKIKSKDFKNFLSYFDSLAISFSFSLLLHNEKKKLPSHLSITDIKHVSVNFSCLATPYLNRSAGLNGLLQRMQPSTSE